jgi:hypothetical protein
MPKGFMLPWPRHQGGFGVNDLSNNSITPLKEGSLTYLNKHWDPPHPMKAQIKAVEIILGMFATALGCIQCPFRCRSRGRRAQIKAVEIILGMFILLVVAAVLLQVFRSFMGQQTGQLQEEMIEQNRQNSLSLALQKCNNLCQQAQAASCSDLAIANYCLEKVEIDYNGNGRKDSMEVGQEAGIYSCEVPVYCFQLTECQRCGVGSQVSGARTCKSKLCSYWQSQGMSGDTLNQMAASQFKPGECLSSPELVNNTSMHWFVLAFGSETASCT